MVGCVNVADFGAVGDALGAVGSISAGSDVLTLAGAFFSPADVGKKVIVQKAGSGGGDLISSVLAFISPFQIQLASPAVGTVSMVRTVWGTDDSTAFATAISTSPCVFVPPGNFLANVVISNRYGVTITGSGNSSQIIPGTGVGILVSASPFTRLDNLMVGWSTTGISASASQGSFFSRLYIAETSEDGLYIPGDGGVEFTLHDVYIQSAGGYGVNYVRSTSIDTGALYMTRVFAQGTTGSKGGMRFYSTAPAPSPLFLIGDNVVADAHPDSSFIFDNVYGVQLLNVFATNNAKPANGAIRLNNVHGPSTGKPAFTMVGAWIQNSSATGFGIHIDGSSSAIMLDGIGFAGTGTALQITGSPSLISLGRHTLETGIVACNDPSKLALAAPPTVASPLGFYTSNIGGPASTFTLLDSAGGGGKYFRVGPAGELQIVNKNFSGLSFSLSDAGDLILPSTVSIGSGSLAVQLFTRLSSGKIQVCAKSATGAIQVLATFP